MAWQFWQPDLDPAIAVGDTAAIDGAEAHHAAAVTRVRAGERIRLADGRGRIATGPVTSASRDRVEIAVERVETEPAPRRELWLAQALAKGDRDERAVQAATELGVARIVPWQASRSVVRWVGDKQHTGVTRWTAIVREAAKQSLRARTPDVDAPVDTAGLAALAATGAMLVVLDPTAAAPLASLLAPGAPLAYAAPLVLVVGPEGGIDEHELARLDAAGAVRARLGAPVLRTSTAGPAALAVVQALAGDWAAGA